MIISILFRGHNDNTWNNSAIKCSWFSQSHQCNQIAKLNLGNLYLGDHAKIRSLLQYWCALVKVGVSNSIYLAAVSAYFIGSLWKWFSRMGKLVELHTFDCLVGSIECSIENRYRCSGSNQLSNLVSPRLGDRIGVYFAFGIMKIRCLSVIL